MKRIILATTALVGIAALTQPALAQVAPGKMQLTLGGYSEISYGFFDTKLRNETGREFRNRTEVFVDGKATADNGLTYGVHIQIRDQPGSAASALRYDDANIFVNGKFGVFEAGDRKGAANRTAVYAPTVGFGQIDSDYDAFYQDASSDLGVAPDTSFLRTPNSDRSTKITYFTPEFAGFQGGISYAPESRVGGSSKGDSVVVSDLGARYRDNIEAALGYNGKFGGLGVKGSLTYSYLNGSNRLFNADATNNGQLKDVNAFQVGLNLSYAGFTVGGGFVENDGAALTENFRTLRGPKTGTGLTRAWEGYNVGATYEFGPFGVGVSYGLLDTNRGDISTLGLGGVYTVAPGLTLAADYYHVTNDAIFTQNPATTQVKDDGNLFILVTRVDF